MGDTHQLDARDLKCPLPVLRARKAIKDVPAGGLLEVQATDPGAPADFEAFCEHHRSHAGSLRRGGRRLHPAGSARTGRPGRRRRRPYAAGAGASSATAAHRRSSSSSVL
ncbi:MAG: sulfurtransferase TusA family protein [Rhodovibrio sp.]|nr:sulfurtransferase TusA family protein [Rhodovibrio sp.]